MTKESESKRKDQAKIILKKLKHDYPRVKIALRFKNKMQLLAAVMLSAQCTDKKVNEVTERLFKKYQSVDDFAVANKKIFEQEIRPVGFYHDKSKNIINAAKIIKNQFSGKIPKKMEDMLILPGVARKTANIVLAESYGVISGIAVDTHVKRISKRLGLSQEEDPVKIEKDLMALFLRKEWPKIALRLIEHGRSICQSRNPLCELCSLSGECPSAFTF